ncbi:condensation domain-containing protein, partial [Streptomyces sp. NPDC020875]|uniref:condensation domain-containing protein n=1 Tax=Streptomyces sp. NPDC020875 TaxID=3154898 RepID=UPI0033ECE4A5
YGPTETTACTTLTTPITPNQPITIGTPNHNTHIHVLDPFLRPVPPGVTGEIYISGIGLARGYLHRPALTAERFIADPYGPPGTRMYRTGDLARWTTDGTLDYQERLDQQVKVRGLRIELGEIEAVLARDPRIDRAAVRTHTDDTGNIRLVGYLVGRPGTTLDIDDIRDRLRKTLPDHMVPGVFMVLAELPTTTSGKLDRRALPAPDLQEQISDQAPRTAREKALAGLFAETLDLPRVGIHDNFFQLGGHSLLATRLTSRIRAALGKEVTVRTLFDHPTVARLTHHLDDTKAVRPTLQAMARPRLVPLSSAQRRLWFLNQLQGPTPTYNIPFIINLSGTVDPEALHRALIDLVERHETLRTTFPETDGTPHQHIHTPDEAEPELLHHRIEPGDLHRSIDEFIRRGFLLAEELPLRVALLTTSPKEHSLVLVVHHIAADGESIRPLLTDLLHFYQHYTDGTATDHRPVLPVQYADYTLWQKTLLGDENDPNSLAAQQLEYWKNNLSNLPETLPLPYDHP